MKCDWQGYAFGARYEDGACCDGVIYDLDSCDEPGGSLSHTHDESCPQCKRTGEISSDKLRLGPMALIRQRAFASMLEDIEACASDELMNYERLERLESLRKSMLNLHRLVDSLESRPRTEAPA